MVDHGETRNKDHPYPGEKVPIILDQFIHYLYSLAIVQHILIIYNRIKCSNKNVEKTFDKVEGGFKVKQKHMLEIIFTFGISIVVIMIQLNLTVLIAIITLLFDAIINGKEVLERASKSSSNAQATARQMVNDLSEKVQKISQASTEKVEEQANHFLDEANRIAYSRMGISPESDVTNKTPWNRIQDLSHRILENSMNRVEELFGHDLIQEALWNA
ncbi:BMA-MDT-28 [Dirofilaria immitis]|nr:BMA-MDT-28 [Dirofilaria immitis]